MTRSPDSAGRAEGGAPSLAGAVPPFSAAKDWSDFIFDKYQRLMEGKSVDVPVWLGSPPSPPWEPCLGEDPKALANFALPDGKGRYHAQLWPIGCWSIHRDAIAPVDPESAVAHLATETNTGRVLAFVAIVAIVAAILSIRR